MIIFQIFIALETSFSVVGSWGWGGVGAWHCPLVAFTGCVSAFLDTPIKLLPHWRLELLLKLRAEG